LQHRSSPPAKESPDIIELSDFLNKMGNALGLPDRNGYRNANGVYMKLMNFRRLDPDYTKEGKVGLTQGNKDEKVVWDEFSSNAERLSLVVAAIRSAIAQHIDDHELDGNDEPEIQEAEEGRVLTRLHRVRERSKKLIEAKKKEALKQHGRLFCEACGFDFSLKYGAAGEGIIDVHHTRPVHTLTDGDRTRLEDLALLCANCHRVVHSSRRWLKVEDVRRMIQN
jgi:5-methylcytosine-specific restriction protein A